MRADIGFNEAGANEKQTILESGVKVSKDIFVGKYEDICKLLIDDQIIDLYHGDKIKAFSKETKMLIGKLEHKKLNNQTKQKIISAIQKIETGEEEENGDEEEFEEVAVLEKNNVLYEVVNDGTDSYFVWLENESVKSAPRVIVDGKKYFPANNTAVKEKAVILPMAVKEYETAEKLLEEISAFIYKYLDVSDDYRLFAAYYILLSWIHDKLTTVPYLRVLGDFSTGKSRFLDVVGKLCYKPIVMAGTVTPAPLYRLQSYWKGTILIDEGDRNKSDQSDEITKILNCGFERGKPVLRCDKDNPDDVQAHDPFGTKVIATRLPFHDQALESRCLTEQMTETEREDIPTILPPTFYEEQEKLRQKLLMFRLKERANIDANKIQEIDLGEIEKRLKQAVSSFAVLFSNKPVLMEKFRQFVRLHQLQLIQEREGSFDGLIVNHLFELSQTRQIDEITPTDIAEYLKAQHNYQDLKPATVGKHLKALGIKIKPEKVEGKTKRLIQWEGKLMDRLFQKYNSEYWQSCNSRNSRNDRNQQKTLAQVTEVSEVTGETETSLEVLQDIPSFVGADMKEYGAFSKGQLVQLPENVARVLIERNLAKVKEELEIQV